jgi:hypothetical protein
MPDVRDAVRERLPAQQRTRIAAMAEHDGLPAGSAIRQAAEPENVIAAVEAMVAQEAAQEAAEKAIEEAIEEADGGSAPKLNRRVSGTRNILERETPRERVLPGCRRPRGQFDRAGDAKVNRTAGLPRR